jgi:hypothetical protein
MDPKHFNSKTEAFEFIHDLCGRGEVQEDCQFIIADLGQNYLVEKVDIKAKTKAERIKFNFFEEKMGNILVFVDPIEQGFEVRIHSKKIRCTYVLDLNMNARFEFFYDLSCKHEFTIDTEAVAKGLLDIKNYFSKKLQSS